MTAAAVTSPDAAARAVTTVRSDDDAELIGLLPAEGALSWVRRGAGLVGWGEAARLEVSGPTALADAAAWWEEFVEGTAVDDPLGLPGSGPVVFASIAFDPVRGTSVFVVPEVVVGRRDGVTWLTTTVRPPGCATPTVRSIPPAGAPRSPPPSGASAAGTCRRWCSPATWS